MLVYQIQQWADGRAVLDKEFDSFEDAEQLACEHLEIFGEPVSMITWNASPNMPGCFPETVYRSCSMQQLTAAGWQSINIHG
jgi:hypothetical protein